MSKTAFINDKTKFLDGGFLYDYYFRVMGTARSQRKLPAVAVANGMTNHFGRKPTTMGCWKAMWRWACQPENHQKAYDLYNAALADMGKFVSFDEFKLILRDRSLVAVQFRNDGQKQRYWRKNKLL